MRTTRSRTLMAHDLILGNISRSWGRNSSVVGADPLVWTPTAARAELDRVRDVLDTVNEEASAAVAAGKVTDAEWRAWRRTYATGHRVTLASSLWGSNVVAARQHEREALKWRDLLKKRSSAMVGPPDLGRPPETSALGANLTTLALAAGGVAALGYLVRSFRRA
jgi:hypothetical protein